MSVYRGEIREYPGVIVDEFSAHTHKAGVAFFLSHAHKDHMKGLEKFAEMLALSNAKLYMTEISKSILSTIIYELTARIEILKVNSPVNIELSKGVKVTVTSLQSGHCPGAVMFLFEGVNGNVLYTGDFRLDAKDLKETRLYREDGDIKQIKSVYLDTTFCHPSADRFIDRDTSRKILLNKTIEWLDCHFENKVCLNFPCLGYEYLIVEIFTEIGIQSNISKSKLSEQYQAISVLKDCITDEVSRININSWEGGKGCKIDPRVLNIKPTIQWFVMNNKLKVECEYIPEELLWRIQHSNHCSYSELTEFVKNICPERIVPICTPVLSSCPQEGVTRLKHLLRPLPPMVTEIFQEDKISSSQIPNRIKRITSSFLEESVCEPVCKKRAQMNHLTPD
ncbi:Protein artemis-like [Oopsacas minuta]|uniref:Protein artemis n=1 Tax=Oopsacas minuta TaxID=111878 RepID=A0AAV7K830_9METZ|nr:Protein artemis-like [Oopsacas minuta]